MIEGTLECREIASIIAVKVLSEKFIKTYDSGNSLQGLGRAFKRAGGPLSFVGFVINP